MADGTKIEWTDATWPVVAGCDHVSPGCDNCYAARLTSGRLKHRPEYAGLAVAGRFTGEVRPLPERLGWPLHWRKPRKIFVSDMADLFHPRIEVGFIAEVFAVMAATPRHTYQVLTKRHGRLRSLLSDPEFLELVKAESATLAHEGIDVTANNPWENWPLPNVWVGVSVEDQRWADIRIPALLATPAAVRWISAEPLLGPVLLSDDWIGVDPYRRDEPRLDWVVTGGESGPGARPPHPDWFRSLRDQCKAAGVAYLHKQWGDWAPGSAPPGSSAREAVVARATGQVHEPPSRLWEAPGADRARINREGWAVVHRAGKRAAGRALDGRVWDQYPGGG